MICGCGALLKWISAQQIMCWISAILGVIPSNIC